MQIVREAKKTRRLEGIRWREGFVKFTAYKRGMGEDKHKVWATSVCVVAPTGKQDVTEQGPSFARAFNATGSNYLVIHLVGLLRSAKPIDSRGTPLAWKHAKDGR